MQNIRIYAAPSLSEVIKQLLMYRLTGVLTLWPATSARQEDTRIIIELGRPIFVYRGLHRENATDPMLAWLNTWGEIHFSFQSTEARLRLPSPREGLSSGAPLKFALPRQQPLSTTTEPHQISAAKSKAANSAPTRGASQQGYASSSSMGRTRELSLTNDLLRQERNMKPAASSNNGSSLTTQTLAVASLTAFGREYAAARLPRYDRTIFLLINGRRSVADLSQLTKRPQEDVYSSLHRLRDLQLITIETWESR